MERPERLQSCNDATRRRGVVNLLTRHHYVAAAPCRSSFDSCRGRSTSRTERRDTPDINIWRWR